MCITHKLMLLALAGVVAGAMMAPTASANEGGIQILKEDGVTPCPNVVVNPDHTASGGCLIHVEGEEHLFLHIFGIESNEFRCRVEFEARIQANGLFYVTRITETAHPNDPQCNDATIEECTEAQTTAAHDFPWAGSGEEDSPGVVGAHFDVCIDPAEAGPCEGEFRMNVTEEENEENGHVDTSMETQHFEAVDERIGASSFCECEFDVET